MMMNSNERKLANYIQEFCSKRETEDLIRQTREEVFGSTYEQLTFMSDKGYTFPNVRQFGDAIMNGKATEFLLAKGFITESNKATEEISEFEIEEDVLYYVVVTSKTSDITKTFNSLCKDEVEELLEETHYYANCKIFKEEN